VINVECFFGGPIIIGKIMSKDKKLDYERKQRIINRNEIELDIADTPHGKMIEIIVPSKICRLTPEQAIEFSRMIYITPYQVLEWAVPNRI